VLWQTGRVGPPTDPNDQSLLGLLARLAAPAAPNHAVWPALAAVALIGGMSRAALLFRRGDDLAGATVTGLTACLISPVSWVHHLYWVVPAVVVLVDVAAGTPVAGPWGRRRPLAAQVAAGVAALVVLGAFCGSLMWFFAGARTGPAAALGENAYVLLVLALVVVLPAREGAAPPASRRLRSGAGRPARGSSSSASRSGSTRSARRCAAPTTPVGHRS
jgi:alpha-1,2-mannosyltransferase